MNTYVVTLDLQIGEYEKQSITLVEALNSESACEIALENECHGDHEMEGEYMIDMSGEMSYCVSTCTEVSIEHAKVLKEYL